MRESAKAREVHVNRTWVSGEGDDLVAIPSRKLLSVNGVPLQRSGRVNSVRNMNPGSTDQFTLPIRRIAGHLSPRWRLPEGREIQPRTKG